MCLWQKSRKWHERRGNWDEILTCLRSVEFPPGIVDSMGDGEMAEDGNNPEDRDHPIEEGPGK